MLSRLCAQTPRKGFHGFRYKWHARRHLLRRRLREHVIGYLLIEHPAFDAVLLAVIESPVVSLASQKDGIDRRVEPAHAVVRFARSAIQPFHVTIRLCDVTIDAGSDVYDDFYAIFNYFMFFSYIVS